MRSGVRRLRAGLVAGSVLAYLLLPLSAAAQSAGSDLAAILGRLSPEERAELLRYLGAAPAAELSVARDVSTPEIVVPREIGAGGSEAGAPGSGTGDSLRIPKDEAALAMSPAEEDSILAAFRPFLVGTGPVPIDLDLEQFGYALFAGAPTTFAPATDIPVSPDYVIGPGDEIHVQLYGKTNLTTDVTVDRDGLVPFPELGPIPVAGLTFREMKDVIEREVQNRMIGVSVSASMGRLRSIRIFVLGEVFRPGSYTVSGLSTLTNALFSSGGVETIGSLRRVQLKRGGTVVKEMDLYDLLIRGDTSDDVRLMPGDVVFVPPVGPLVGVAGEVLRPAIYELKGPLTVRGLIELAGGLRPTADAGLIQLERVSDGQRATYDLGLSEAGAWALKDGDLLKVYPIRENNERAVFLEGNVVRPGAREYADGMRLLDLFESPDDLLPETYFDYGLIVRERALNREPTYVAFDLGAALLDADPEADLPLMPRDRVCVFHRGHFRDVPRVSVRGEVRAPGRYEHKKDMRVLDLILAAGGVTRDVWLEEAEVFRTDPLTRDVVKLRIDLRLAFDDDPDHNIILEDLDELAVHSIWEFKPEEHVEILGEVNNPGRFPLFRGMRVSDLLFSGGSLRESAYTREAELTRYDVVDGERREQHHVLVDLEAVLAGSEEADLLLRPYDRLLIRRITNWRGREVVEVAGEVAFPGSYPIEEGERLSDLIERFGGFLDDAYLPAAVFTRKEIRRLQEEQLERMASQLESDLARLSAPSTGSRSASDIARRDAALAAASQLVAELRSTAAIGRMVIQLAEANELRGTDEDVVLADGDRLYVPKRPEFVMVMGQVHNPTAFQFDKGKSVDHYVRLAGGRTRFGDARRTYVVKADGSVARRRGSRIEPGDVVIVPENLDRFGGMQFLLDISQVLYQIGLAAASAHTVGLFD
jgi:polysaccharide export outer membrane protein